MAKDKTRIMIIDKHEAVRRALQIRLNVPSHFEVVGSFPEIGTALTQLSNLKPDVIILGLQNSSDYDRNKTATAVREIAREAAVVIALAPYMDAIERELLLNAGAKRYLLKQINSEELIHVIEINAPNHRNNIVEIG